MGVLHPFFLSWLFLPGGDKKAEVETLENEHGCSFSSVVGVTAGICETCCSRFRAEFEIGSNPLYPWLGYRFWPGRSCATRTPTPAKPGPKPAGFSY